MNAQMCNNVLEGVLVAMIIVCNASLFVFVILCTTELPQDKTSNIFDLSIMLYSFLLIISGLVVLLFVLWFYDESKKSSHSTSSRKNTFVKKDLYNPYTDEYCIIDIEPELNNV